MNFVKREQEFVAEMLVSSGQQTDHPHIHIDVLRVSTQWGELILPYQRRRGVIDQWWPLHHPKYNTHELPIITNRIARLGELQQRINKQDYPRYMFVDEPFRRLNNTGTQYSHVYFLAETLKEDGQYLYLEGRVIFSGSIYHNQLQNIHATFPANALKPWPDHDQT